VRVCDEWRSFEDYIQVELHAYDADGRELTLQDGMQVTWDTAPDLFQARPHGDIVPVFDPSVVLTLRPKHTAIIA
jgi:hypothetical protein